MQRHYKPSARDIIKENLSSKMHLLTLGPLHIQHSRNTNAEKFTLYQTWELICKKKRNICRPTLYIVYVISVWRMLCDRQQLNSEWLTIFERIMKLFGEFANPILIKTMNNRKSWWYINRRTYYFCFVRCQWWVPLRQLFSVYSWRVENAEKVRPTFFSQSQFKTCRMKMRYGWEAQIDIR